MNEVIKNKIKYYFDDTGSNRKQLFKEALVNARNGKVVYIVCEELNELPELSQELNIQYMKMISFLYPKNFVSLIENISSLSDWQSIPCTLIIDNLDDYCPKNKLQNACGLLALLTDVARRCSKLQKVDCKLIISVNKQNVGEDYCSVLRDLYVFVE